MTPEKSPAQCNSCFHVVLDDDNIQSGCSLHLLEKLNAYRATDNDSYYSLEKICLFKNKDKESVDVKIGYIFILNDTSLENELYKNIEKIKDDNPRWVAVILDTTDLNGAIKNNLDKLGCKYNIVTNFKEVDSIYKIDQCIEFLQNGWTVVNIVGEELLQPREKLSKFIFDGNRAALIKKSKDPDDIQINGIVFYNYIFKMLKGNLPELTEDGFYITKSFAHKVHEKSPDMIISMEDI
jgi:hypothetical protein